ncbi:hypothetical protein RUND412_008171 [Rhizina undulata]
MSKSVYSGVSSKPSKAAFADDFGSNSIEGASSSVTIPLLAEPFLDPHVNTYDDEVLPGYEDATNPDLMESADLPPPFRVYKPQMKKVKKINGDIAIVSHDIHLNTDGEALYRWLKEENKTCPRPQIRIRGSHTETRRKNNKTETSTITDFDVTLDVTYCLLDREKPGILKVVESDQKAHRGGRIKRLAKVGEAGRTIRDWADEYCSNKAMLKEFSMTKVILNHDKLFLEEQLTALIRSTNYRGQIHVSFPVQESRVEIYPDNRISRMRQSKAWRWFFYLTFLWIISWPILWFLTKRYSVVHSVWKMARYADDPFAGDDVHPGRRLMRVTNVSEWEWLETWAPAIIRCVLARRQGEITELDLETEARARFVARRGVHVPSTALDGVLGAAASITRDFSIARQTMMGWGGDEDSDW